MSKLEERENRRKSSVVGKIVDTPTEVEQTSAAGRGRPKAERELKKRISLSMKGIAK